WERAYHAAWQTYYTMDHMETVLRRLVATRGKASNALLLLTWFKGSIGIEGIHPLESGFFRKKFRRDRRPGLPNEPVWKFYPGYFAETVRKTIAFASLYLKLRKIYVRIKRDAHKYDYTDVALTPVTDDDLEMLELFHTPAGEAYVTREAEVAAFRAGVAVGS